MILNIVSTPAPPKAKKAAKALPRHNGRRPQSRSYSGRPSQAPPAAAAASTSAAPPSTIEPEPEAARRTDAPVKRDSRPPKRPRVAPQASNGKPVHGNSNGAFRKEDPAKAAALPRTLALDGADREAAQGQSRTFSADQFGDLLLEPLLQQQLGKLGLSSLTQVQRETIPLLLQARLSRAAHASRPAPHAPCHAPHRE